MVNLLSWVNGLIWVILMIALVAAEIVTTGAWAKLHTEGRAGKAMVRLLADFLTTLIFMVAAYAILGSLLGGILVLCSNLGYMFHRGWQALSYALLVDNEVARIRHEQRLIREHHDQRSRQVV